MPSSRRSSQPEIKTKSPTLQADSFKAYMYVCVYNMESLCCIYENNTALKINYISVKNIIYAQEKTIFNTVHIILANHGFPGS